ncbi:MAG: helix-turn-helix domain-containing protein [Oenococcus oeni]
MSYSPANSNHGKRAIYFGIHDSYLANNYSVTQLAKKYAISRSTVYWIMKRIKEEQINKCLNRYSGYIIR